jgi:hypothetical protein
MFSLPAKPDIREQRRAESPVTIEYDHVLGLGQEVRRSRGEGYGRALARIISPMLVMCTLLRVMVALVPVMVALVPVMVVAVVDASLFFDLLRGQGELDPELD